MYDELNLDEEEEKFRMPNDESESEDSEEASEGALAIVCLFFRCLIIHQACLYGRRRRSTMRRVWQAVINEIVRY